MVTPPFIRVIRCNNPSIITIIGGVLSGDWSQNVKYTVQHPNYQVPYLSFEHQIEKDVVTTPYKTLETLNMLLRTSQRNINKSEEEEVLNTHSHRSWWGLGDIFQKKIHQIIYSKEVMYNIEIGYSVYMYMAWKKHKTIGF